MKRHVWLIVGISGLIAAGVSVALFLVFSAGSMTNDSVIALAKSGFSEWLIIEKIKSSRTDFDTSANELVRLKEAGVTETVIYTMLNPAEAKGSSSKTATVARKEAAATVAPVAVARGRCEASTSGDQPWLSRGTKAMWYSTSETSSHVEMLYERGTINRQQIFMVNVTLLELTPLHANLRLGNRPVFWSCINPTDMPLVRFSQDEKGNERNTSLSRGWTMSQKTSISKEDIVPMAYEKTSGGLYKITPKTALERGEYGFVPQATGGHFTMGERVYSFGVD